MGLSITNASRGCDYIWAKSMDIGLSSISSINSYRFVFFLIAGFLSRSYTIIRDESLFSYLSNSILCFKVVSDLLRSGSRNRMRRKQTPRAYVSLEAISKRKRHSYGFEFACFLSSGAMKTKFLCIGYPL